MLQAGFRHDLLGIKKGTVRPQGDEEAMQSSREDALTFATLHISGTQQHAPGQFK